MLATWSNSKERLTNEDKANMCFIAIKDHKDKVNFITNNDDDLEGAFEEMYLELENFGKKYVSLKNKILSLDKELNYLKNILKMYGRQGHF